MIRTAMTNGKGIAASQLDHPLRQKLAARREMVWGNEHWHAALTASALLLAGLVTRWVGLIIAPLACLVFALALLVADVRTRIAERKHHASH